MSSDDESTDDRDEIEVILKAADCVHEHGLSIPTRTIFLTSEAAKIDGPESGVDSKMAERFMKNLHVLEALSGSPVRVLMNNVGGDMYHGLAIWDAMRMSRCDLEVVVRGHAMSMGSIILQAAEKRVMGPTATQMVHYGSMGVEAESATFHKWAGEAKRLDKWVEGMYLARIREKRPEFTLARLRKILDHDSFFSAEESVAMGLADEVG